MILAAEAIARYAAADLLTRLAIDPPRHGSLACYLGGGLDARCTDPACRSWARGLIVRCYERRAQRRHVLPARPIKVAPPGGSRDDAVTAPRRRP